MKKTELTIKEASQLCAVSSRTIQRKLKDGKLKRVTLEGGKTGITLTSLKSAFSDVATVATCRDNVTPTDTTSNTVDLEKALAENEALKREIKAQERNITNLEKSLDHAHKTAERAQQSLLADQQERYLLAAPKENRHAKTTEGEIIDHPSQAPTSKKTEKASTSNAEPTKKELKKMQKEAKKNPKGLWKRRHWFRPT